CDLVTGVQTCALPIFKRVVFSRKQIVIKEASKESEFSEDPYIQQNQPKSILCFPLLHLGAVKGMIYLENNLLTGAFTQERLNVRSEERRVGKTEQTR